MTDAMIWIGAAATLAGVGLLLWCVRRALTLRKAGLADADLRSGLQKIVAVNMAALGLSALGLGLVVAGILLG
jgi:hypothetical protein